MTTLPLSTHFDTVALTIDDALEFAPLLAAYVQDMKRGAPRHPDLYYAESLLRDRAPADDIEAARQQVAALLEPLVAGLRNALTPSAERSIATATVVVDAAQSRKAGAQLRTLLSDSDPGAGDFLDTNRDALRALFDDASWAEFEALVQGYAFEDAHERLQRALEISAGRH